jgi:hypothetical protein
MMAAAPIVSQFHREAIEALRTVQSTEAGGNMKFIKKIITDFVCSETGDFIISVGMSILVLLALVVLVVNL